MPFYPFTGQGQADYSAAWAAYYQQLYQQQAAVAAGQAAPGMMMKTIFLAGCKAMQMIVRWVREGLNLLAYRYLLCFFFLENCTKRSGTDMPVF